VRLFVGRGPRYSTITRLQLVGPLPLDAPTAAICLCTVLRCLARVWMMPRITCACALECRPICITCALVSAYMYHVRTCVSALVKLDPSSLGQFRDVDHGRGREFVEGWDCHSARLSFSFEEESTFFFALLARRQICWVGLRGNPAEERLAAEGSL